MDQRTSSARRNQGGGLRRLLLIAAPAATAVLFVFNVRANYFLSDDAYISFRYARHLAEGLGLVWNPGEAVEGYTNFLWVVLLAGAMKLGLDPEVVANFLGIASGAGVIAAVAAFSFRMGSRQDPLIWLAPLCLAASRSFTAWCTGGLETTFFTLLVFLGFSSLFRERERRAAWPVASPVLFALASLTRPEGLLFAGIAGASIGIDVIRDRRAARGIVVWLIPLVVLVGSHFAWRHAYYGTWLPNSFHAKVPGAWWDQGLRYLGLFLSDYRLGGFLALLVVGHLLRRRQANRVLLAALFSYAVYVAYVGGDRFEFRFMVPVLPLLYWLLGDALQGLFVAGARNRWGRLPLRGIAAAAALGLLATTATGANSAAADGIRHGIAGLATIEGYASRRAEEGRFLRRLIDAGRLPADVVLCVGGAGAVPYYTAWPTVDRRGINDFEIARLPIGERGVVGHERDAPYDYLRRRGVVIFDVFNRLVHDRDVTGGRGGTFAHDGKSLPLEILEFDGRYLIFATVLPRNAVRLALGRDPSP